MKRTIVMMLLTLFTANSVQAMIASEPFDGTADADVVDSLGGTGWGGSWVDLTGTNTAFNFTDPGLEFSTMKVRGLKATFMGNDSNAATLYNRLLSAPVTVDASNPELWASFLLELNETQAGRGCGVELTNGGTAVVGFGKAINKQIGLGYSIFTKEGWGNLTGVTKAGITYLALKMAYDGADTQVTLYATKGEDGFDLYDVSTWLATESITVTGTLTVDGVSIYGYRIASNSNSIDELRLANTYEDFHTKLANTPSPANNKTGVSIDQTLSWSGPSEYDTTGYDVWFGTDPGSLSQIGTAKQTETTADPSPTDSLLNDTLYYWRVDAYEPNEPAEDYLHTGELWNFRTETPDIVILTDPASVTVAQNNPAQMAITADYANGSTIYAWHHNDDVDPLSNDGNITGADTPTLNIANVQESHEGIYYCVATNTNPDSTDTSARALLMTERLVAQWEFDGDLIDSVSGGAKWTGVIVDPNDSNGDAPDVAIVAGAGISGSQGLVCGANTGTTGYQAACVEIPGSEEFFNFYLQGITVAAWIKTDDNSANHNIASKYDASSNSGWALDKSNSGSVFTVESIASASSGAVNVADGEKWHLLVGQYDPVAGEERLYVDGVLRDTNAGTAETDPVNVTILIGADDVDAEAGTISLPFVGTIDDVRIYSSILDPVTIGYLYTDVTGETICQDSTGLEYDFNDDCIIDLQDFALFTETWLNCRRIPNNKCQ